MDFQPDTHTLPDRQAQREMRVRAFALRHGNNEKIDSLTASILVGVVAGETC